MCPQSRGRPVWAPGLLLAVTPGVASAGPPASGGDGAGGAAGELREGVGSLADGPEWGPQGKGQAAWGCGLTCTEEPGSQFRGCPGGRRAGQPPASGSACLPLCPCRLLPRRPLGPLLTATKATWQQGGAGPGPTLALPPQLWGARWQPVWGPSMPHGHCVLASAGVGAGRSQPCACPGTAFPGLPLGCQGRSRAPACSAAQGGPSVHAGTEGCPPQPTHGGSRRHAAARMDPRTCCSVSWTHVQETAGM